ncbi:MAG: asparagine synthase-related protein, partial [Alphaproteobacteria bacterium]
PDAVEPFTGVPDDFNVVSRVEMTRYMRNTLLRDADANSMTHALELRVPFLDTRLIEAVASLPGHVKHSTRGHGKRLLRAAMTKVLPLEVKSRSKTGFELPTDEWMRGEMRDFCEAAIEACADLAPFDGQEVRRVWKNYVDSCNREAWARPFAMVVTGAFLRSRLT